MEKLISQIIKIDDNAKSIVKKQENIKKRLQEHIESEYKIKEDLLIEKYNNDIKNKNDEYDNKFKIEVQKIEEETQIILNQISDDINNNRENIMNQIINEIKQEVN